MAGKKTRYTDRELAQFDRLIVKKLADANDQLAFYSNQVQDLANSDIAKVKGLDDGVGTAERERIATMTLRQKKLIQHLENARLRIKNKVYGICRVTGKLISKERLKAVPHATLSIEAKQLQK